MTQKKHFGGFRKDENGAAALEFAVVAFAFCLIFMAVLEYGLFTMTQVAIESAVAKGGRTASIGGTTNGCDRVCTVRNEIMARTRGLIRASSVTVTANTVTAGSGGTQAPDICILPNGQDPTSSDPTCSCQGCYFVEVNGQPGYQGAGQMSLGGGGDVVEIRASYPWRILFPIAGRFFGQNGVVSISSSTIVKNENF